MALYTLPKQYHPDFSEPRKKPFGDVELDLTNPLTKGLLNFELFNGHGKGSLNLVNNSIFDDGTNNINNVGFTRSTGVHGRKIISDRSQNQELMLHPDRAVPSGSETTILTGVVYNAGNVDQTLVHIGTTIAVNNNVLMWADTDGGQLRPAFNCLGSVFGASASIPTNQFTVWGLNFTALSSAPVIFYVDGVQKGSGTAGQADAIPVSPWRYANDVNSNRGVDGDLFFYAVWGRGLTAAEHKSFSDDPYQILKPKNPPMYFTTAAVVAGGDLLLTNRSIANFQGMRQ